ncbi:MAG: DNA repair protein RadC [Treponema sp.]|jgi:DNA repair protein RadC|nr:DNA repair protein RadC [Treponema sp.]
MKGRFQISNDGSDIAPYCLPDFLRPREKLLKKGPEALSDGELLAILLNTGIRGKSVTVLAGEVVELLDRTKNVPSVKDMSALSGLGSAKACTVAAMLELGRRRWGQRGLCVNSPDDAFNLVRHYGDRRQERFVCISLNGAHEVIAVRVVTVGLINRTIVHPREVFSDPLQDRASAVCVAHNHPSGKLVPSGEDNEITYRLKKAADILGLRFLDHLIFSDEGFFSYSRSGLLKGDAVSCVFEAAGPAKNGVFRPF